MRAAFGALAVGALLLALSPAAAQLRVCVPFAADAAYLQRCSDFFATHASSTGLTYTCVSVSSARECMRRLKTGDVQVARFGGDDMYIAGAEEMLPAVVAEDNGAGLGAAYYSVAVVRKSFCEGRTPILNDLRDKRMCSTGYRRSAGWSLPVGYMIAEGVMPVVDNEPSVQNDAESVSSFFSTVCAGRTTNEGPVITSSGGGRFDDLCGGCKGDCSVRDPYYDYAGSFVCLKENRGDVSFTKHDIPLTDATINKDDYRLLCKQGGCRSLDDFAACNIAKSAAHAVFVAPSLPTADRQKLVNALVSMGANALLAGSDLNNLSATTRTPLPFFIQSSAKSLRAITETFESYFGPSATEAFSAIRKLYVPSVRICAVGSAEQAFCGKVADNLNDQGLGFRFSCVQRDTSTGCIAAVRAGDAEMTTLDGGDIYQAQKGTNALKVIAAEDYGLAAAAQQYYAVAVVSRDFCSANANVTFGDLRGKRSCHTGYKRSAGWAVPVGYMVSAGVMAVPRKEDGVQDDAEAVANFFSASCAGRTADNGPVITSDGRGSLWEPLCSACKREGNPNRCTTSDPYYDYAGAFRCLMERAGDVAFTKHSIVQDFSADGASPQAWSTRSMEDFRLLCPSGGCAPVTRASTCHISRVPAHAVMVRSDYAQTQLLKNALATASRSPEFVSLVFNASSNPNNLLFKSSAVSLQGVNDDTRSFLGSALRVYEGLEAFSDGGSTGVVVQDQGPVASGTNGGNGSGNNLSDGDIAGIVIGCSIGTALIAVLITLLIVRRRQDDGMYGRYAEAAKPVNTGSVALSSAPGHV